MKGLCQLFRCDKRKTEAVSLMTLVVPYIAPAHCRHNATLVCFFALLARCSFWWFLRWAEEVLCSACNDNSRQNKTASLRRFTVFSHIRHWTCCVPNKYANDFAGGHWTTRRLFFLSVAELRTMWIAAVKILIFPFFFFSFIDFFPSCRWTTKFVHTHSAP